MYNGVINVYKEAGFTSHDVVNRLRRVLGQKKIGHTGTLDPAATGVLPVCLGAGTRLCDLFADHIKEYAVVMKLGMTTDTLDITGQVCELKPVSVTRETIEKAAASFVGDIFQLPPMYSAVKMNGRKLYELARKGIEVERTPRQVTIHQIRLERFDGDEVTMHVTCGKGTYIRTLCADMGELLGCGACVSALERTRVGDFRKENALTLSQIEKENETGELADRIVPVDDMFPEAPRAKVEKEADLRLHNGNQFAFEELHFYEPIPAEGRPKQVRLYDSEDVFMGLYAWEQRRRFYHPLKMFLPI